MAIYHLSVKIGSKGKGQSAIAAAAYRSGSKLTDKQSGEVVNFMNKGGVVYSEIALCANAPTEYADRETLWNAVHLIEKSNTAQLWREFEVALPKELSRDEQIKIVKKFVKMLTDQGMCADWSIHDKGDGNPHAHIMATMRSIKEDGSWAPKSRLVYDLDENGERIFQKINKQGRKQFKNHKEEYNDWNKKERIEEWRKAWADCCNQYLDEQSKIDHRSYAAQGLDLIPTEHEGYAARRIVAEGGTSERVENNRQIRERNNRLIEAVKELQRCFAEQLRQQLEEIRRLFELVKQAAEEQAKKRLQAAREQAEREQAEAIVQAEAKKKQSSHGSTSRKRRSFLRRTADERTRQFEFWTGLTPVSTVAKKEVKRNHDDISRSI